MRANLALDALPRFLFGGPVVSTVAHTLRPAARVVLEGTIDGLCFGQLPQRTPAPPASRAGTSGNDPIQAETVQLGQTYHSRTVTWGVEEQWSTTTTIPLFAGTVF